MTNIPLATYRLQLSANFTLKQVQQIIPYLHELGVSTIYAAPFFTARAGSAHGYDVVNPLQINPEIGTLEEFKQITQMLAKYKMTWLQDIVPNHMAYDRANAWLMDVLALGSKSNFYNFFDIDFKHPHFEGQVMVPFLGNPLDQVLEDHEIKLDFDETGFTISYFDNVYPASLPSYLPLLQQLEGAQEKLKIGLDKIKQLSDAETVTTNEWQHLKSELYEHITQDKALHNALQNLLKKINSDKEALQNLLAQQHYKFSFWQETMEHINYRRFFTINDLICLRMELPETFVHYHQFIKQLCDQKLVQGLRVDHVDGLFDPDLYLQQLRNLAGEESYIIVEKILEGDESLPQWPIQGNSGYDFLAWVGNLYTSPTGKEKLTQVYRRLIPSASPEYEQLEYNKKLFILQERMNGELDNLLRVLVDRKFIPADADLKVWRSALEVFLASFPIYRIYGNKFPLAAAALETVDKAFAKAAEKNPDVQEQLNYLRSLFETTDDDSEEVKQNKLYFVMRSQQFTGPLAAKGVEDTTFYNYNRLISLNEVGNSPDIFHLEPEEFHQRMQYKLETFPHSLNATATHDTKRGEDARMRINVLSEASEEWDNLAEKWLEKARLLVPNTAPNDVYFLLQTIIGVMPHNLEVDDTLIQRIQDYIQKALREAKKRTNWAEPNEAYEEKVQKLAQKLLQQDPEFMAEFTPFFKRISYYGSIYSLCQTLLKVTCPGVPDIYQGTEFWDLSLVDPDNRRPVDYEQRHHYLQDLEKSENESIPQLHESLLGQMDDARIKLYLLTKALHARQSLPDLFNAGNYIPLSLTGKHKDHAIAFARNYNEKWCVVVVPRLLYNLVPTCKAPVGKDVWEDTAVILPDNAPKEWQQVYGQPEDIKANKTMPLATILQTFPVALLTATTS